MISFQHSTLSKRSKERAKHSLPFPQQIRACVCVSTPKFGGTNCFDTCVTSHRDLGAGCSPIDQALHGLFG